MDLADGVSKLYSPSAWGHLFHNLDHDEALGGGSAGPGKSFVLLMDPFQQIAIEHERCLPEDQPHPLLEQLMGPEWKKYLIPWGSSMGWALHLRRSAPELRDNLRRAHRIFPLIDPGVKWNENKSTFTFSSGYQYTFGQCHDSGDWASYLGFEFTYIGWDELVTFEEEQYDQINTRLRTADPVLRKLLKIRAMTNPMMVRPKGATYSVKDPNWVRRRFVDPAPDGKVTLKRVTKRRDGREVVYRIIYIPATLYDNPSQEFIDEYEARLLNAKPHIRQALLYGNWYMKEGAYYGDVWNKTIHVCRPFKIPRDWPKWRSMDWGFKMPGCVHWWAMDEDGNIYCFREMPFQGKTAKDAAVAIKQIEEGYKLVKNGRSMLSGPADTQLWEQRGDSTKGKAQEMEEEGVSWVRAKKGPGSRIRNAELLYDRLADHESGTTTPGIVFFEGCSEVIKLITSIVEDPNNPEEPADGDDDHALDSCWYSCSYASHGRAGIGWRDLDSDDLDKEDKPAAKRGRWGYGSQVM